MTDEIIPLLLPNFLVMNDEEIAAHPLTRVLDGRWSAQTLSLMEKFGTIALDLNDAWAATWQKWTCPGCGRTKKDIARPSSKQLLQCRLHRHHDHMQDFVRETIAHLGGSEASANSNGRGFARSAAYLLLEGFASTLVCEDCNTAEGLMKTRLPEIDPFFSFSPAEIAQFVKPSPNKVHGLKEDAGAQIWAKKKDWHHDRLAFARTLSQRIVDGSHDREFAAPDNAPSEFQVLYSLAHRACDRRSRLGQIAADLRTRSRSAHGHGSKKSSARRDIEIPTPSDFAAIDNGNSSVRIWNEAGPDWSCEGCGRSKFEICRKSNKGKWTASIHGITVFREELDPIARAWRLRTAPAETVIGDSGRAFICQDCREFGARSSTLFGSDGARFGLDDIRALAAGAVPHRPHAIDNVVLRERASALAPWSEAISDFYHHRAEYGSISLDVKFAASRGLSAPEALEWVFDRYLQKRPNPLEDEWDRFEWLLSEANRTDEV